MWLICCAVSGWIDFPLQPLEPLVPALLLSTVPPRLDHHIEHPLMPQLKGCKWAVKLGLLQDDSRIPRMFGMRTVSLLTRFCPIKCKLVSAPGCPKLSGSKKIWYGMVWAWLCQLDGTKTRIHMVPNPKQSLYTIQIDGRAKYVQHLTCWYAYIFDWLVDWLMYIFDSTFSNYFWSKQISVLCWWMPLWCSASRMQLSPTAVASSSQLVSGNGLATIGKFTYDLKKSDMRKPWNSFNDPCRKIICFTILFVLWGGVILQ